MKKIIIILFPFLITITPAVAQFTRGTFMAGGDFSYNHYKNNDSYSGGPTTTVSTGHDFYVQPQAGYFVVDNFAAGLGLNYMAQVTKQKGSDAKETDISKSLAPFVRYYYHHFFGQAVYEWGVGKTKFVDTDAVDASYRSQAWRAGAGYALLLNSNIAIEPQISYRAQYQKRVNGDGTEITAGLFLSVGIQIYLNRK